MVNLYFVPTPIGNLDDMTIRGVETLKASDVIYSSDIEETKKLLSYYKIDKPLYCYKGKELEVIELLKNKTISIVSFEGYSGIDEESHKICTMAIQKGFSVEVIPGPNYLLTGLVSSGIPCDKFLYYGYIEREEDLKEIIDFDKTLVFFSGFDKVERDLASLASNLGSRDAVLCLNLTKEDEKFIRFTLGEKVDIDETNSKIVIVISGAKIKSETKMLNDLDINLHYDYYLKQGFDNKEAMKKVAKDRGVSKSDIYRMINGKKE